MSDSCLSENWQVDTLSRKTPNQTVFIHQKSIGSHGGKRRIKIFGKPRDWNWTFGRREKLVLADKIQQSLNQKGGPVKKEVNQIGREGQMKKRKRQKKSTTGLNLWGRANGWLCDAHSQLGTCGFIQSKRNWKMRRGIGNRSCEKNFPCLGIVKYEIRCYLQIRRAVKLGAMRVAAPAST